MTASSSWGAAGFSVACRVPWLLLPVPWMRLMSAVTVVTPFWMFTGKPLPIPAAADWTAAAAVFVRA